MNAETTRFVIALFCASSTLPTMAMAAGDQTPPASGMAAVALLSEKINTAICALPETAKSEDVQAAAAYVADQSGMGREVIQAALRKAQLEIKCKRRIAVSALRVVSANRLLGTGTGGIAAGSNGFGGGPVVGGGGGGSDYTNAR